MRKYESCVCPICNAGKMEKEPRITHRVFDGFIQNGKVYGYYIICPKKAAIEETEGRIPIGY